MDALPSQLSGGAIFHGVAASPSRAPLHACQLLHAQVTAAWNSSDSVVHVLKLLLETSEGLCAQDNGFREGDHVRRIPFEVMVRGDKQPFYEETLEVRGAERSKSPRK